MRDLMVKKEEAIAERVEAAQRERNNHKELC
jgi:hypothetical protein